MDTFVYSDGAVDEIDQTIIRTLLVDGRMSIPALAQHVGISRAAAYNRFDRLVESGAISGFAATIPPEALGLDIAALLLLTGTEQAQWEKVEEQLLKIDGVQWVALAASNFDYIVLVRAAGLSNLRDVVLKQIHGVEGVAGAQTSLLLSEARGISAIS